MKQETNVGNRWWAEVGKEKQPQQPDKRGPVGSRFFRVGEGFEQDSARDRLTDNNLRILQEAQPVEGQWAHVVLGERRCAEDKKQRLLQDLAVPPYARLVLVDCGKNFRILATGTPVGERVLDLTLGASPSFDCWIRGEWVREETYRSIGEALRRFRSLMKRFLSPEAIALSEEVSPRA